MGSGEHESLVRPVPFIQMRYITIFHEITGIDLSCAQWTILPIQLILQASLIGRIHIEIPDATLISASDNRT